jgi:hypothetical protein
MKLSAIPIGWIVFDPARANEPAGFVVLGCPHPDGHGTLRAAEGCARKVLAGNPERAPKTLRVAASS